MLVMKTVACWETPRGRYDDEHSSKSFPQYETKVESTSRRKKSLLKVDATDVGRAHYRCQQQRGTCTQHNQTTLPQRYSEVVNLTGLAENKGLDV